MLISLALYVVSVIVCILFLAKIYNFIQIGHTNLMWLNYVYLALLFIFSSTLVLIMYRTFLLKQEVVTVEKIVTVYRTENESEDIAASEHEKLREQEKIVDETARRILAELGHFESKKELADKLLSLLAKEFNLVQGLLFYKDHTDETYKMLGRYAYYSDEDPREFKAGDGISGQVIKDKKILNINNIPDNYITVLSGLGKGSPKHLVLMPIIYNDTVVALAELASFSQIEGLSEKILTKITGNIAQKLQEII